MKFPIVGIGLVMTLWCYRSLAEQHQHEAHVHGEATLNLVIDNNELLFELESPAANVLGFEHAAENKAERQQWAKTQKLLSDHATLISLDHNHCRLISADIDLPYSDDHDEHSDGHHSDHSEIRAEYRLSCDKDDNISQISVNLFHHFPALEKLNVMWIKENKQGAITLSANTNTKKIELPE